MLIDGKPAGHLGVNARRRLGAAFVPEERNGHAAAPAMSLSENVVLSRHATAPLTRFGFLRRGTAQALASRVIEAFDVRKAGPDPAAGTLSGGNLQKFVVGREILAAPGLLVVDQPTWGVDAAAAARIRQALIDLAASGSAVLAISQDLDELFEIAESIAVLHAGQLSPAVPRRQTSREAVGLLMGGGEAAPSCVGHPAPSREPPMRLDLVPRGQRSPWAEALSPTLAFLAAVLIGGIAVSAMGVSPGAAFAAYFIAPLPKRGPCRRSPSRRRPSRSSRPGSPSATGRTSGISGPRASSSSAALPGA